jgi:hypothetical protein
LSCMSLPQAGSEAAQGGGDEEPMEVATAMSEFDDNLRRDLTEILLAEDEEVMRAVDAGGGSGNLLAVPPVQPSTFRGRGRGRGMGSA